VRKKWLNFKHMVIEMYIEDTEIKLTWRVNKS